MSRKGDFLDPSQQHTLTEQECELVTFFRTLSTTKRQVVIQALFSLLLDDHMKKADRRERKKKTEE